MDYAKMFFLKNMSSVALIFGNFSFDAIDHFIFNVSMLAPSEFLNAGKQYLVFSVATVQFLWLLMIIKCYPRRRGRPNELVVILLPIGYRMSKLQKLVQRDLGYIKVKECK